MILHCLVSFLALQGNGFNEPEQQAKSEVISQDFQEQIFCLVQGFLSSQEEIDSKEEIFELIEQVRAHKVYIQEGSDDFRSKFVHTQAFFENAVGRLLALGEIQTLVGVIHTPMPPTPLCTEVAREVSDSLLDPSIHWDPDKLNTIRSRAEIIRTYLSQGGVLYSAYPEKGLKSRTEKQQKIYQKALSEYLENLIDSPLYCDEMDPEKIGATYLIKTKDNQIFAFSIKSRQANDVQKNSEWGIWFGNITDPLIEERLKDILDYLSLQGLWRS